MPRHSLVHRIIEIVTDRSLEIAMSNPQEDASTRELFN
jgi:hypothetical protein